MEINRKAALGVFLHIIDCISDKAYQRRVWIEGAGPECDDFDATVNDFFEDDDAILADYQACGLSDSQYQILKQFRDQFRTFADEDESDFPEEFIDTPEWSRITEFAKEVLKAFNYQKP